MMPARNTLTWGFGAGVLYGPSTRMPINLLSRLGFPLDMAALEELVVALLAHRLAMLKSSRFRLLCKRAGTTPHPASCRYPRWYH